MSPLHGLRLNCLLAPLLAALVGAVAVIAGGALHRTWSERGAARHELAAIHGLAQLSESAPPPLAAWQAAHPTWRALARVQVLGDAVTVLEQVGEPALRGGPPPQLLLAYQQPQRWTAGGLVAVAAPCLPHQGAASVIVGWREAAVPPPWWPWLLGAGGVLLLGGGLGVYLVARVYRPVEWMERAAAAAAAGGAVPADDADSLETASLRSSIATLISQRHSSAPADAASTQ